MAFTPIYFVGDVESQWKLFNQVLLTIPAEARVVQCGDLGLKKYNITNDGFSGPKKPGFVRSIDHVPGNHEHWPYYKGLTQPTEIYPGVRAMPAAWVEEWGGRRIGFLGGAHSIDWQYRTPGMNWFPEENITLESCDLLRKRVEESGKLDLLVTHTPPTTTIWRFCFRYGKIPFSGDQSALLLENVWKDIGKPTIVCAHMHSPSGVFHDNVMGSDVYVLPELGVLKL